MPVGGFRIRPSVIGIALVVACGGEDRSESPRQSRLERAIDAELGKRAGGRVRTRCERSEPSCTARLPDGTELPIDLVQLDGEWEWRVRGLVVDAAEVERYLELEVADLGAPQRVRCGPRLQRLDPDERIACQLEQGGVAFVTIRDDGETAFEVVLDPAAAAARGEEVTPERDQHLLAISAALAPRTNEESDRAESDGQGDGHALDEDDTPPRSSMDRVVPR
jgi:hypothetical protein